MISDLQPYHVGIEDELVARTDVEGLVPDLVHGETAIAADPLSSPPRK